MRLKLILVLLLALSGNCIGQTDQSLQAQVETLQKQVDALRNFVLNLSSRTETALSVATEALGSHHGSALIETSSANSFTTVDSSIGRILITFKTVQPYLTGYRVFLEIGNPHAAKVTDYSYEVWWGNRTVGDAGTDGDWYKNRKHRKFHASVPLEPGRWRKVSFTLPDTAATEIKYLEISLSVNQVDMPVQPPQQSSPLQ